MRSALLGLYTYVEFFLMVLLFLPLLAIAAVLSAGEPTRRLPGRVMRLLGRTSARLTPLWKFGVQGAEPKDIHTRGYVVVSNHESTADPFLLSFLPWDMRWVGKEELFRPPVTGWAFRLGGDIPLRRGDGASVRQVMAACRQTLEHGMPVILFPEGTRSPDGRLLPFKDGAFSLAIEAGVPVLPVALVGTRQCRPKGSLWFGEARAVVRVLEPIPTAGLTRADVARVRDEARMRIAAAVVELREELGLMGVVHPLAQPEAVAPVAVPAASPSA